MTSVTNRCDFLSSSPFFRETSTDREGEAGVLVFLVEFARFMNKKAPELLTVREIYTYVKTEEGSNSRSCNEPS